MAGSVRKEYMDAFAKTEKLGLVSTVEECGDPHITLLSTLMAADETTMVVGQFAQGISKENMAARKKAGFLILTLDLNWWRGTMDWREVRTEGPEYVRYNEMQMFRFNTYFGVEKVHYADLREISERERLKIGGTVRNLIRAAAAKGRLSGKKDARVMRHFAVKLFNGPLNPKFLSFVREDGYPVLVPVLQAQAAGTDRVVFTAKPYADLVSGLEKGARVAVLGLTLQLESVLVKGTFSGFKGGIGYVDVDRVYNPMPPVTGYIYPETPYAPVTDF